jgi:hypothetical protein
VTQLDREFDHAVNDSPRSGSSKHASPVVWCMIVVAVVALTTYFVLH